jgi:bifunctional UDP-N-acetylglucosamine pyrophosphorylase/glucosamine-1-phosphate N-acetyltransferase
MAGLVRQYLASRQNVGFVVQEPQLGTGHALLQTEPVLGELTGTVLMLSGDVPRLRTRTLRNLLNTHDRSGAAATVLTAEFQDPTGYGRMVRESGVVTRIVEERDASADERRISEINSGIYAFDLAPLFEALRGLAPQNVQAEYYLPDLVAIYRRRGLEVATVLLHDPGEIQGINSRTELAEVSAIVRTEKNQQLMAAGVTLEDPATTYIHQDVTVGPDTIIHPGVSLEGQTRVGSGCEIHSGVRIVDSVLGDRVLVRNHCVIANSRIADEAKVGPFAHLRPDSDVGQGAHVGNFVELKKTVLGTGSKANHLAYLGDATIGAGVNVGAGTITCNYDGKRKYETVIEDGAFIGSDTQLIAPIRIGRGAYVAAGSSITEDVPPGSLAVARGRQVNKEGWVSKQNTESRMQKPEK